MTRPDKEDSCLGAELCLLCPSPTGEIEYAALTMMPVGALRHGLTLYDGPRRFSLAVLGRTKYNLLAQLTYQGPGFNYDEEHIGRTDYGR